MEFLTPDWPAPPRVRAISTTRCGGVSSRPFDTFNLAAHVDDDPSRVEENRRRLRGHLKLSHEPFWLEQIHGADVVRIEASVSDRRADAAWTDQPGQACTVMTADCLPVIFATVDGRKVAAAHAGWRGLAGGVLEATVEALSAVPHEILAWLGPAIGQPHFEVGGEVRDIFVRLDPDAAQAFVENDQGRWQADLYCLARQHLARIGVHAVYGGGRCTYRERELFFSHRRDSGRTGRMATLVWID